MRSSAALQRVSPTTERISMRWAPSVPNANPHTRRIASVIIGVLQSAGSIRTDSSERKNLDCSDRSSISPTGSV